MAFSSSQANATWPQWLHRLHFICLLQFHSRRTSLRCVLCLPISTTFLQWCLLFCAAGWFCVSSVFVFSKAILVGVSWFFMVLICFSLTTNWCQTSHGLVDCVLSLEKTTQSFCPFFKLNYVSPSFNCGRSLFLIQMLTDI